MLKDGIIVPSSSAWSFPLVIATKTDDWFHCFVKYLEHIRFIKQDGWLAEKVEEIFYELPGAVMFTKLDFYTGYWQVCMSVACKEMTIFIRRYEI